MEDDVVSIERLITEHEEALAKIRGCDEAAHDLESISQSWSPGRSAELEQELTRLEEALESIGTYLAEHIRVEEQEFLPTLTKYAADIVSRGVLYEHGKILESISDLRKHARDLVGKPADREQLLNRQSKIKESINSIMQLVQEHAQKSEIIYDLAREALAKK